MTDSFMKLIKDASQGPNQCDCGCSDGDGFDKAEALSSMNDQFDMLAEIVLGQKVKFEQAGFSEHIIEVMCVNLYANILQRST